MEFLGAIGIFFGGLGFLFIGCGVFWFISLYSQKKQFINQTKPLVLTMGIGAGGGIRTRDVLLGKQALYR